MERWTGCLITCLLLLLAFSGVADSIAGTGGRNRFSGAVEKRHIQIGRDGIAHLDGHTYAG